MDELTRECILYFQSKKGFHRLFSKMKNRYRSLGRVGGSVVITRPTDEERDVLEGFFQQSYRKQQTITISLERMDKILQNTRFSGVTLEDVLNGYFYHPIQTKAEEKSLKKEKEERLWGNIIEVYEGTFSGAWLRFIYHQRGAIFQLVSKMLEEDHDGIEGLLNAGNALPVFENKAERLAIFSTKMTKNPHYFDEGTTGNTILLSMARYFSNRNMNQEGENKKQDNYQTIVKNELLYRVGLMREDILNYTNIYGIHMKKDDGTMHEGGEGFIKENEPFQVSLLTLSKIKSAKIEGNVVYVVENSGVFSELVERTKYPRAIICTNGQLHLASLVLLDILYQEGYTLYYAGDFDPEGILIAQRLKDRYGKSLCLWHYTKDDYEKAMSNVRLTDTRLKKCKAIDAPELNQVKNLILESELAGYQESLIEDYLEDMERNSIS